MDATPHTALLIGASRGLGLGLAREYLARGWHVVATARDPARAPELQALAAGHAEQLRVETLDVTDAGAAAALAGILAGTRVDLLFVVAGMNAHAGEPIHEVSAEDVSREFLTNAYAPPVVAEALLGLLAPGGTVAFMTSSLGSIAGNTGGFELYRATKAALNMLGASFARRHSKHPVLLLHPGWVRTDMGGAQAPLDVETSVKGLADVVAANAKPGVAFIDYQGAVIAW